MNDSGVMAFTATLMTDQTDVPTAVVVRQEGTKPKAVVTNLDAPPGLTGASLEEFSAPLVTSDGNLLFGARCPPLSPTSALRIEHSRQM
jgi:hypothetical protein